MKYTEITTDQVFEIISNVVKDEEFINSVSEVEISKQEIIDGLEDLFYELTKEEGYSFRGMKKEDKELFKAFLNMIVRTNVELYVKK